MKLPVIKWLAKYWPLSMILLLISGDRLGGVMLDTISVNSQFRYSRLYADKADAQILLAGNSRGLMFYQPFIEENTGKSTFNFSYNGMPVSLVSVLIKDYLDRYDSAEVLFLDITLLDRNMHLKLIPAFMPFTNYSSRLKNLIRTSNKKSYIASELSHLYRYNGEVFQRTLFHLNNDDENWLLDREISPAIAAQVEQLPDFSFEVTPASWSELKSLINFTKQKGVEVKLLVNPYFPPYVSKLTNLDQLIADTEKVTGLKVHDYSKALKPDDGFGDYQHLNKKGSAVFLKKLIQDGVLTIPMQ
jgi:hypothetical protein